MRADKNKKNRALIEHDYQLIKTAADKAAAEVLACRQDMDEQGKANDTLFVHVGESHFSPAEYIFHILLLERLKAGPGTKITCGVELDHNYFETDCDEFKHVKGSLKYAYDACAHARDHFDGGGASNGRKLFFDYLAAQAQDKIIRPVFNDAACTVFDEIDIGDKLTRSIMRKHGGIVKPFTDTTGREGIYIRNRVMTDMLADVSIEHGSRIALQFCGVYHVAGGANTYAEESLSALRMAKNTSFLNIFLCDLPDEVLECDTQHFVLGTEFPQREADNGRAKVNAVLGEDKYTPMPMTERQYVGVLKRYILPQI